MRKYIYLTMALVIFMSVSMFSPKVEASNPTSYSIKDQSLKPLTLHVKTLKKKKDYESTYFSYQLSTQYPKKKAKVLSKKVMSQYYIDGDTSCAAGSDDKVRVINQKASASMIYVERDFCGDKSIIDIYTIKNGNLQKVKLPDEVYLSSVKFTGKNKLQGWYKYRDGNKTTYNFTYNVNKNALTLVDSYTEY